MKFILVSVSLLSISVCPRAQQLKPPIDSAAIANWADILWSEPVISNNGKYFMYAIDNVPVGNKTLVVQSTENGWKKEFVGADKGFFSSDNKLAVSKSNDTLYLLSLGENKLTAISGINSYNIIRGGEFLAYQSNSKELIIRNLLNNKEQHYRNVASYQFDKRETSLLIKSWQQQGINNSETVQVINLSSNKGVAIWHTSDNDSSSSNKFSFDDEGKQLAFIVQKKNKDQVQNSIWYYREGMKEAVEKVSAKIEGSFSRMIVSNKTPSFSKNGNYIFFKVESPSQILPKDDPGGIMVDVWNYKEPVIQYAQQLYVSKPGYSELSSQVDAIFSLEKNSCVYRGELENINGFVSGPSDYILVGETKYVGDKRWELNPTSYYLMCLTNGFRLNIPSPVFSYDDIFFSKDGRFLIFSDGKNYFSFEMSVKKFVNVTEIGVGDNGDTSNSQLKFAGWLGNDAIIVYDDYDIWKFDLTGRLKPVNLTGGYGRKNKIILRAIHDKSIQEDVEFTNNKKILVSGFNFENKYNGFFYVDPLKVSNPQLLTLGPYVYYVEASQTDPSLINKRPVKALNADKWIVQRQTAFNAPDFFLTADFKEFKQLTNVQPQSKYSWYTTRLVKWQKPGGDNCQGILYLPENFDSTKKYPVIVEYYQKLSDQLNQFTRPGHSGAGLNYPWFTSRGYVIFTPDINYTIGKPVESILNSVISGVEEIFRLSYVDSTKVGVEGHSFGGYETNVLITHSNLFKAAVEGAGPTNLVSFYGSVLPNHATPTMEGHFTRSGQLRIGTTMWTDRNLYIKNSPIFFADKVSTPLLIMHNKNDNSVPLGQAVEFFIALRRLNKSCWMLQYDKGGHGVHDAEAADYTTRMTQYFDHYLKGAPAPKWMTQGIPAKMKGIDNGLALDPAGKCSETCPVCNKAKAKATIQ